MNGEVVDVASMDRTCPDVYKSGHFSAISNAEPLKECALNSPKSEQEVSVLGAVEDGSEKMPFRAAGLSNRGRLLLREQGLGMKKHPVLAVGKSNIVTGVAKTIKTHFLKHPLAIVNIKGRAKGTSVQEVVSELERATGAVLVSQEPSKVILYRGWGQAINLEDPRGRIQEVWGIHQQAKKIEFVQSSLLSSCQQSDFNVGCSREEKTVG